MVRAQKTMYKCGMKRLPATKYLTKSRHFESLLNADCGFRPKNLETVRISFADLSRAIEIGDELMIDKAMSVPAVNVEFADMNTGVTVLHLAAKCNAKILEKLLTHEMVFNYLNTPDNRGITPMFVTAWYGNVPAMRVLIKKGAHLSDPMLGANRTALHIAAAHERDSVIKEILKHNEMTSYLNHFDHNGDTALMIATELDTKAVHWLLAAGADYTVANPFTGRNIMHLAVLHQHHNLIADFMKLSSSSDFLGAKDKDGIMPLQMATRLPDSYASSVLLDWISTKELTETYPDVIHDIIAMGDLELLKKALTFSDSSMINNYVDENGNTALMHAIELEFLDAVHLLLMRNVDVSAQKSNQGSTVLHKAALTDNVDIIRAILGAKNVVNIINETDGDGSTAYEIILEQSNLVCLEAFRESGLFNDRSVNARNETALHAAAKRNNYKIVLTLLLSESCTEFLSSVGTHYLDHYQINRAYMKGYISASDVFIMIGERPDKDIKYTVPEQHHLFGRSKNGQNIFHACALGGDVRCLIFLYNYCSLFHPDELKSLDKPDKNGSTPMLTACLAESTDVVQFLAIKGANICKSNNEGMSPLKALPIHVSGYQQLLLTLLSNCIVSDTGLMNQKSSKDSLRFTIYQNLLCPKGLRQTHVVTKMIEVLNQPKDFEVLGHPLLAFFVWSVWAKIRWSTNARFVVCLVQTVLLSLYVTVKYCNQIHLGTWALGYLWWVNLASCILSFLVNIPPSLVCTNFWSGFMFKMLVASPLVCIVYLVFFNGIDRTSLEIGSLAVLFSWLSLFGHDLGSPISKQMAMFQVVFFAMIRYSPVFLLIMASFAFYFFTLFHDYLTFNNPFHAFLYTAFQLPTGDISSIPSIGDNLAPVRGNHTEFSSVHRNATDAKIVPKTEARGMIMQGTTIILYLLYVTSITNMLTSLAVRSGEDIEIGGDVVRLSMKIRRMDEWDLFISSRAFQWLRKFPILLTLMLVPVSMRQEFKIPTEVHPLTTDVKGFNLFKLKRFVTEKSDLISEWPLRYLTEWVTGRQMASPSRQVMYADGTQSTYNKMFLDI